MSKEKKKQLGVLGLIVALVVVLIGGLLFVGAVSGWFDNTKVILDAEYYSDEAKMVDVTKDEYEELIKARKSFVVLVDQGGCHTADRLREFITNYMQESGIVINRIMYEEMKSTSLHKDVKFYPSVALISEGRVVGYLRADSDEDTDKYNDYEAFKTWIEKYL